MALYFYEDFEDEATSSSDIFVTKTPLEPYVTFISTGRTGSHGVSMTLPTNWASLVGHPGTEYRWNGVVPTGAAIGGQTNRDTETWMGFSMLIPPETSVTGTQITVAQWHKDVSGSTPPYALRLQADGTFRVLLRTPAGNFAYDTAWVAVQNTWYDFVIHADWSTSSGGLIETWIDGVQLVNRSGANVDTSDGTTFLYLKNGLYIPSWRTAAGDQNKTLYFDEFRWGDSTNSFSTVDPAQGGGTAPPVDPPTPPSGVGNIVVRSEYANSPTNTTSVVMTDADITGTPSAALTFAVATTGARLSAGMIAGSTNLISVRTKTAVTTSDTRGKPSQTNIVELMNDANTSIAHAATGSLGTGGLTLAKGVAPGNAAEVIAMLFAGADVDADVHVFDNSVSLNGTYTKTGLSFEPNLLFFFNVNRDFTLGTDVTNARFNIGIATTAANQYNYSWYELHNAATADVRAQLSSGKVMQSLSTALYLELTSIESDGYVITTRGSATAAQETAVLAMRIDASIYLNLIQMATGTGTTSYTVGFAPQAALIFSTQMQALGTTKFNYEAGAFGIGMLDEDGNRALAISSEDNVGTTVTESYSNDSFVWLPDDAGTTQIVGAGSLGTTSVDVNFTSVGGATYGILLAIEHVEPDSSRAKKRKLRQGLGFGLRAGF